MLENRSLIRLSLGLAALTHLVLLADVPLVWRTCAALLLTVFLPGLLLVEGVVRHYALRLRPAEWLLCGLGSGYGLLVIMLLALSYLSGGVSRSQTLLVFDVLLVGLLALALRRQGRPPLPPAASGSPAYLPWLLGAGLLFLVGGSLRLIHLGYAEFQGDEARAVLRAAAVIQGHEEVLFLHRKGPTEILLPTALYALTGELTEETARLPFALAGLTLLFAIWMLGARLWSPLAGWLAALLLAVDGHSIAYARIVQYHAVEHLMMILVVWGLCRAVAAPHRAAPYLLGVAFFLATGLLAHYEMAQLGLIGALALGILWRQGLSLPRLGSTLWLPLVVGGGMVAAFYLPFVLHPNFGQIADYLAENLGEGEGGFPYNHLGQVWSFATFYSSLPYLLCLAALGVAALARLYQRGLGQRLGWLVACLWSGGVGVALWQPHWLRVGAIDLTLPWFAVAALLVWQMPLTRRERLLWLWLGVGIGLALFATARTSLHYIPLLMPWSLLGGWALARAYQCLGARLGPRVASRLGGAVVALGLVLFGGIAYGQFVYHDVELLRTWGAPGTRPWWLTPERPANLPIFGIPHQSGWKVIGLLYQRGVLAGSYDTNAREWVADWYARRPLRCERAHRYFILESGEASSQQPELQARLQADYHLWGVVEVHGQPRLDIYEWGQDATPIPRVFEATEYEGQFDGTLAHAFFELNDPTTLPRPTYPLDYRLGESVWLTGYDLERSQVRPGESLHLTLYWHVTGEMEEVYTTFTQVIQPDGAIAGQNDRPPGCRERPTDRWELGSNWVDRYEVPIFPATQPGVYPLLVGWYRAESGERLPVYTAEGQPIGNNIPLTSLTVEGPP